MENQQDSDPAEESDRAQEPGLGRGRETQGMLPLSSQGRQE